MAGYPGQGSRRGVVAAALALVVALGFGVLVGWAAFHDDGSKTTAAQAPVCPGGEIKRTRESDAQFRHELMRMTYCRRNHPSIIMWSMCNEEGLQGSAEGVAIFKAMMDKVHLYDTTRPITCADRGMPRSSCRRTIRPTVSTTWRARS